MRKKLITLFAVLIVLTSVGYISGCRLDGLSAAKANIFVPRDSILVDQVDYEWGSVYMLDSKENLRTAISFKKYGFFWYSNISTYQSHNEDLIQTIGGVSLANPKEQATVISIVVTDSKVSYLEAGPEMDKQKREVVLGQPITFNWNRSIQWNELAPKAFSKEGKLLYEYRYAKPNVLKTEDLKWYTTDEEKPV